MNDEASKFAEPDLRSSDERLRRVLETDAVGVLFFSYDGTVTDANDAFLKMTGYSREQVRNGELHWRHMTPEEWVPESEAQMEKLAKTGRIGPYEKQYIMADGSRRWMLFAGRDLGDRTIVEYCVDTTAQKTAEEHQKVLLAELQHRVRNSLAVVRSIARRTAENSTSVDEMLAHFQGRLDAFSRVQAKLIRGLDNRVDLMSMIEDEMVAHAAREGEQVRIGGPDVALEPKLAERLSLAVHELATNAVKHGALGTDDGRVSIIWEQQHCANGESLLLKWEESGVHLDGEPMREGFGMDLLRRSLPYNLGAETRIDFRPHGLSFELKVPLAAAAGT